METGKFVGKTEMGIDERYLLCYDDTVCSKMQNMKQMRRRGVFMYDKEEYEEEIDIKDLCIFILKQWRKILIAILIGALILGGYQAAKGVLISSRTDTEKTDTEKTDSEEAAEFKSYKEQLTAQQKILDQKSVVQIREKKIENDQQAITYCEERLEYYTEQLADRNEQLDRFQTMVADVQSTEDLLTVNQQILSMQTEILSIESEIDTIRNRIYSYESEIISLEDTLEAQNIAWQILVADYEYTYEVPYEDEVVWEDGEIFVISAAGEETVLPAEESEEEDTTESSSVSVKSVIKFAVIGGILGAFVECGIAFLQYIFSKKLRGAEDLTNRYGIRVLGSLYQIPAEKDKGLDHQLNRLAGYGKPVNAGQEYTLIAANIQAVLGQSDESCQPVLVTGTVSEDRLKAVAEKLEAILPAGQYRVTAAANPVYDAPALLSAKNASVLLVEAKDSSDKNEIEKLMVVLQACDSQVLGAVML
jgi:hypothetical protein